MKKLLLLSSALIGVALVATSIHAQVNTVPQVGVLSNYQGKTTYSSAFVGLVPVTAGTDVICIAGSATKTVKLQSLKISGTTATAVQSLPVVMLKRVTVDTGGTAASTTANPGTTTQIMSRSATNAAASATLISYVANPTITDTAPTYLDAASLTMPVVTTAAIIVPLVFDYARDNANLLQPPTLTGAAMQICANIQGVTVTNASVWNGSLTWTEE
jgi:hypothetical protein